MPSATEQLVELVRAQLPAYRLALCRAPAGSAILCAAELAAANDGALDEAGTQTLLARLPGLEAAGADAEAQQQLVIGWEALAAAWEGQGDVPYRPEHLTKATIQHCLRSGTLSTLWDMAYGMGPLKELTVQSVELEDGIQAGFGYLSAMSRVAITYSNPKVAAAVGLPTSIIAKLTPLPRG